MTDSIASFIARWRDSGAAERANYQLFLAELCDVLEVERPQPTTPDDAANAYVFEKSVPLPHGATGRMDLYRRGCFVLEAKQGRDPDADAAGRARQRGTALRGAAGVGYRDGAGADALTGVSGRPGRLTGGLAGEATG